MLCNLDRQMRRSTETVQTKSMAWLQTSKFQGSVTNYPGAQQRRRINI
jgi:CRISPR/Cas system-associated endoribonuclease Cas2